MLCQGDTPNQRTIASISFLGTKIHCLFTFFFLSVEDILCVSSFQVYKKVQVGKDQEKAQSEKDSHYKNRGGKKQLTITYLYHENIS